MTTTTTTDTRDRADAIKALARDWHVAVTAKPDGVVTVYARFPAGDRAAYGLAETACLAVLAQFPYVEPGSVWGTDSGSIGGLTGIAGGYCRMNKSGVSRRLARQFLGADPELILSVTGALRAHDEQRDRTSAIERHALDLRAALAELADDGDDHLAHLGGQVIDRAAELADAEAGRGGCAAELRADLANLTARIRKLLAVTP